MSLTRKQVAAMQALANLTAKDQHACLPSIMASLVDHPNVKEIEEADEAEVLGLYESLKSVHLVTEMEWEGKRCFALTTAGYRRPEINVWD